VAKERELLLIPERESAHTPLSDTW